MIDTMSKRKIGEETGSPNKRLKTRDENEWLTCEVAVTGISTLKCLYKQREWTTNELDLLDVCTNSLLIADLLKLIVGYIPFITPYYLIDCLFDPGRGGWTEQTWYRCHDAGYNCRFGVGDIKSLCKRWHPGVVVRNQNDLLLSATNLDQTVAYASRRELVAFARKPNTLSIQSFVSKARLNWGVYRNVEKNKQRDIYLDVMSYSPVLTKT